MNSRVQAQFDSQDFSDVEVRRGQHCMMHDHESMVEVIVISVGTTQYRVIDRQGFFHVAVVAESEEHGLHLRSLVPAVHRKKLGYDPKLHVKLGWTRLIDTVVALRDRERFHYAY